MLHRMFSQHNLNNRLGVEGNIVQIYDALIP